MTSPLLHRPGAVPAEAPDAGVAAHYGDPYREQRALDAGDAVVDLSHHAVVRVQGPDRLSWLHSLTTQHLTALPAGQWTQALVLSPQGHVEHHLQLVDDGTGLLAVLEPGTAHDLLAFLERMRFLLRVELDDVSEQWVAVGTRDGLRLEPRSWLTAYAGGLAASRRGRRCASPRAGLACGSTPTTGPSRTRCAG